ncbi:MAG: matrixin family metalloprotease [Candidatus Aenigmarchaeota archaeon]|nr:matrixin family metalloprotease [Candidatus Aenigmarchaeota archaeon]
MNLVNSILGIVLLSLLIVIGYKVGQIVIELNSPAIPKINETKFTLPPEPSQNITLRWNHFPLTVYIDDGFVKEKSYYVDDFRKALEIWEDSTNNLVSFSAVSSGGDIAVEWSPALKEKASDTLGNTDLKFVNISGLGLIQNAKIELLTRSDSKQLSETDMTNLALHEIGHALGLNHSNDENDIMYPILVVPSKEIKQISAAEIQKLQDAYKLPARPDLRIMEVNVTKATIKKFGITFHLINMSMIIENAGLTDAVSPVLRIDTENEKVKQDMLPTISVGNRLSVIFGNLRTDNNFDTIKLTLDPDNLVEELNEGNNVILLNVT